MSARPPRGWRPARLLRAAVLPLLAGCLALAGRAPLDASRPGATTFHAIAVGARTRSFLLHRPPGRTGPVPLLLAFHGHGGNAGVLAMQSGLDAAADEAGFAVAYLNGSGSLGLVHLSWNAATCCGEAEADKVDDVAFAHAVIDTLAARGLADRARVAAAGFSAGGMLALRLACERTPLVRAVADVAGAMPDTTCRAQGEVAVLLVRGDRDDDLAFDHAEHRRRNNHGYATSFDGARTFWARHNACDPVPVASSTAAATRITLTGCRPGGQVTELIVHGQGHAWPGGRASWPLAPHPRRDVHASREILDFAAAAMR